MNSRNAQKIVDRFRHSPYVYKPEQVRKAYKVLGRPVDLDRWEAYTKAREQKAAELAEVRKGALLRAGTRVTRRLTNIASFKARREARAANRERKEAEMRALVEQEIQRRSEAEDQAAAEALLKQITAHGLKSLTVEREEDETLSQFEEHDRDIEEAFDTAQTRVQLAELSVAKLRHLAKTRGLGGYSKLNKGELVDLLIRTAEQRTVYIHDNS